MIIDFSFWSDQYTQLIEKAGGKWKRIFFKVHEEDLRERLKKRNKRFDANAFPITEDLLTSYLNGFEIPIGEGEIVIEN